MLRKSILLAGVAVLTASTQSFAAEEPCRDTVLANLSLLHDGYAHVWCLNLSKHKNAYHMFAEYVASGKLVTAKVKFDPETCQIQGYEPMGDDEKIKRKDWRKSCDEGPFDE